MAVKTNALRLLEQAGIEYAAYDYPVEDGRIDAVSVAGKLGAPPEQVFKTLVTAGAVPGESFVFVIPGDRELDLRKAARAAGRKSVAMLPARQLLPLTGYVHGGCSPIGLKKPLPTWIDETALLFAFIYVSAGRIGLNVSVAPDALAAFLPAGFADLVS